MRRRESNIPLAEVFGSEHDHSLQRPWIGVLLPGLVSGPPPTVSTTEPSVLWTNCL